MDALAQAKHALEQAKLIGRTGVAAIAVKQNKGAAVLNVPVVVKNVREGFGRVDYNVAVAGDATGSAAWINSTSVTLDKEAN